MLDARIRQPKFKINDVVRLVPSFSSDMQFDVIGYDEPCRPTNVVLFPREGGLFCGADEVNMELVPEDEIVPRAGK